MAKLESAESSAISPLAIPAHTQLLAVAWLRWRVFANTFRRQQAGKRQVIGLLLITFLRLVIWTIFSLIAMGSVVACGFFARKAVADNHPQSLLPLLGCISAAWQFLSINGLSVASNTSSFDPSSLARFPVPFGRYLLLRTLLGLLTPSTVVGCLGLLAAAIGVGIANASLALPALVVLAVYALTNIFFTRMLAAWLERGLATRRYREIFGVLMTLFFVGIQFLSYSLSSGGGTGSWLVHFLQASHPFLRWLPPGFAANSILLSGRPVAELAQFSSLLTCTALFLAIFAMGLHKQFLGEYLSEGAARSNPATLVSRARRFSRPPVATESPTESKTQALSSSRPVIAACLRKEWLDLRGSGNQLIGMLTPLIFLVMLGKGVFGQHPSLFLPGAIGYVLLGLFPRFYNVFGADGNGVQLYLLAPIRLRDVILAKNIVSLTMILCQAMLTWVVALLLTKTPIGLSTQISAFLWMLFVVAANLAVGTLRSIQAPSKSVPGKGVQVRTPANRTSTLLVLALFFGSILLQVPVTLVSHYFGLPWLAVLIFAPLAAGAILAYALLLRRGEQLTLSHRDLLAQELCRD